MRQVLAARTHSLVRVGCFQMALLPQEIRVSVKRPKHSYSYQCRATRFFLPLDRFEFELHHLSPNHETQVVFSKFSKAQEMVHQEFEPEIAP